MRNSYHTLPRVEALESRALLSSTSGLIRGLIPHHVAEGAGALLFSNSGLVHISRVREAHADFDIPHGPPTSPLVGGGAALVGSVLLVVTNKLGNFANEATIQDDGAGNVIVEWNGHTPPTFHGVTRVVVDARGKSNSINFTLKGDVTTPQEVDLRLDGTNSFLSTNLGSFKTNGMLAFQIQTAPTPRNLAKGP